MGELDPNLDVAGGLALGWRMEELYLAKLEKGTRIRQEDLSKALSLISWTDLSDNQKAIVLIQEIQARLRTLGLESDSAPDFKLVATAFETASVNDRGAFNDALQKLHIHLITLTTARDPRIGKAYRLGFAMAETVFLPYRLGPAQFKEVLKKYRLPNIYGWLIDLKSALPDHSSEAVQASLKSWEAWYSGIGASAVTDPTWGQPIHEALRKQAEAWRAILTGEKRAVDLLTTADYLRAAGDMASHVAALTAKVVKTPTAIWIGVVLAAVVVVVAIIGLFTGGAAITVTIAALGALGITAGGISAAVQKALHPVQDALWQADLSGAVGIAATELPQAPAPKAAQATAPAAPKATEPAQPAAPEAAKATLSATTNAAEPARPAAPKPTDAARRGRP